MGRLDDGVSRLDVAGAGASGALGLRLVGEAIEACGNGSPGPSSSGQRVLTFRLDALQGRPGTQERAVRGEVLVRHQRRHLAVSKDRGQKLARHRRGQQPVAVLRKYRLSLSPFPK